MRKYDVVVVGAGNGGISAAVALVQQGLKPLVIEQHNMPGGCATSFVRGRFEFDATLHHLYYDMLGFKQIWEDKMNIDANVALIPNGQTFSYVDEKGKPACHFYPDGAEEFLEEFGIQFPHAKQKMQELMGLCQELDVGMFLANSPEFTPELMNERCPHFFKLAEMTAKQVFDEFKMPVEVTRFVGSAWWQMGDNIEDISFPMIAACFYWPIVHPLYFTRKTCHEYLAKMEKMIRDNGGDIWYNTEVTEIVMNGDKVCGVKTNKGDYINTDNVVANVSPRVVLESLIKDGGVKQAQLLAEQKRIPEKFSYSEVYLGLNASAEELGIRSHHLIFTDTDDQMETYRASETFDGPFTFGALCPNITVPDFSPEGTCVLSICIPMQSFAVDGLGQEDYVKTKREFANKIVKRTSIHLGVNLFDYIEEIEVMTPVTLARYAYTRGGGLGYAADPKNDKLMVSATQKLNSSKGIEGLYFVGQYAFGIGYRNIISGYTAGAQFAQRIKEGK